MKRNQAYVLLVGLLILVVFLAGMYWSTKNSPQSISLPPTDSDILDENATSDSFQAQQFTQSQLKQLYGEEYPLLLGPIDKQYKLKGRLTKVVIENKELAPGYVSRAQAEFEYLDAQQQKQIILIPLIVDNQETNQSVYLLGKISDTLATEEEISAHVREEVAYSGEPIEMSVSFAKPKDHGDMMLAELVMGDAINSLHPDGFVQFIQTGEKSAIGNTSGWLLPIYISLSK